MPIPIRRFHIKYINKKLEEEREKAEAEAGVTRLSKENNPMSTMPDQAKQQLKKEVIQKKPTYSTNIKPKK